jgi:hypothetical protein
LLGEFEVRRSSSREILGFFWTPGHVIDLFGEFASRHASSEELLSELTSRHSSSLELLGEFTSRHSASEVLLSYFTSRHAGSVDFLNALIVRHSASRELLGSFVVRHSANTEFLAGFVVRHSASADLLNAVIVRHSTSIPFYARFAIRHEYPYWTNRRLINGVVSEEEDLIGDAKLEIVIEGVMDDIKVWAESETISYDTWTSLDTVPLAIKRATTYGVVAALYARRTKTFHTEVVPTITPISLTVIGEAKQAMQHWESKQHDMMERYISTAGPDRIWVSTANMEPIFSLDDIPPVGGVRETRTWHEWLDEYGYPEEIEE